MRATGELRPPTSEVRADANVSDINANVNCLLSVEMTRSSNMCSREPMHFEILNRTQLVPGGINANRIPIRRGRRGYRIVDPLVHNYRSLSAPDSVT